MTKTWRKLITDEMNDRGESMKCVIAIAPANLDMDALFDSNYGSIEGQPFTLWTASRVYFPACYDGREWVESVPRNPCDEITKHVGG